MDGNAAAQLIIHQSAVEDYAASLLNVTSAPYHHPSSHCIFRRRFGRQGALRLGVLLGLQQHRPRCDVRMCLGGPPLSGRSERPCC